MLLDSGWYHNAGEQGDTVISSRVRLARNISSVPFPVRLNVNRKNEINEMEPPKRNSHSSTD